jgi:F-type H+-transporting ATPase subunit epsilon
MTLTVRVLSPDKTVWDGTADEAILPSTTGQLGILTGHIPLLTTIDTGVMRVRADNRWVPIALMGGFAEIDNNEITVLVNGAELGSNIEIEAARTEFTKAEQRLTAAANASAQEKFEAERDVKRARAKVQAAGGVE